MPALYAITASPRGDYSISTALTHTFIKAYQEAHPGATVVTRDLYKTELPFVDVPWMTGAYTPPEQHSPEIKKAVAISDMLIAEIMAADHIVLGTPMYNFTVPAIVKAWIDHVARVNVTFTPKYEGLVKGKKVTIIIASGGLYTPGAYTESYNMESSYLRAILGFLGMTEINIVLAGGASGINTGAITQEALVAQFAPEVEAAAKA